jgi:hypothetical protein
VKQKPSDKKKIAISSVLFVVLFAISGLITYFALENFAGFPLVYYAKTSNFGCPINKLTGEIDNNCPSTIEGYSIQNLLVDMVIWWAASMIIVWIYYKVKK